MTGVTGVVEEEEEKEKGKKFLRAQRPIKGSTKGPRGSKNENHPTLVDFNAVFF